MEWVRWNGVAGLAALEVIVHVPREFLLLDWRVISVEVPDDAIEVAAVKRLPEAWRDQPSSRRFGGAWLEKAEDLALTLPGVVVPRERAQLPNPRHPAAAKLKCSGSERFVFDRRMG